MEYTVQQLDDMCRRIDEISMQLGQGGAGLREDQAVSEAVQMIQRMGESIAWAYGQQHRSGLGEEFAQPFVDRRMRDRLKALLTERAVLRRESQSRVAAQILQTIHILLQATPQESTLFSYLTAGWYLNEVVSEQYNFRDNDDLLPLWMTVVKEIAVMLTKDNFMLFFDPNSQEPFPIFSKAIRYYHHPVSQVRTHVQATTLEIFAKLRDEEFWDEPRFQQVLAEYFTHVSCLLREFWRMVDHAVRAGGGAGGARRDLRSALHIQNDILMYVNDVFTCDIRRVSDILQEKLLRFAVLPVLVRSMLRPRDAPQEYQKDMLMPSTAWFLLYDTLSTLRSAPLSATVAFALLRPDVPEEVLRLIFFSPPPRTPQQYLSMQALWGSQITPPGTFDRGAPMSDEALYAVPSYFLVEFLKSRGAPRPLVRNTLLDSLEAVLRGLGASASETTRDGDTACAASLLGVVTLLLRTLRSTKEALADGVAERLGSALCSALAMHRQLKWAALEGTLCALRELAALVDMPTGHAKHVLGPPLQERVLTPLASEVLQASKQPPGPAQEVWLEEFQEQWAAHQLTLSEPAAGAQERELLEQGADREAPGAPMGRARCLRVLLCARRLGLSLGLKFGLDRDHPRLDDMPGLDEAEAEEFSRFQPGVPVHIGRVNRVKCVVTAKSGTQEVLYLLPGQALLILVRPDEQKPFWAVPVLVEPLRHVRLNLGNEKTGAPLEQLHPVPGGDTGAVNNSANGATNGDEAQRVLRLEVTSPRSPLLASQRPPASPTPRMPDRGPDNLAVTAPMPAGLLGGSLTMEDRMAVTVPGALQLGADASVEKGLIRPKATPVLLLFADERRRRVACKILYQARHHLTQKMSDNLSMFLDEVRGQRLNAEGT